MSENTKNAGNAGNTSVSDDNEENEKRLKKLVATALGKSEEEIHPESRFINDLGADSLDLVELMMAIEDEFDCVIPDEEAAKVQTIADAIKYINDHKKTSA
ncbi:MAG: acyl carrier protein [Rickettsiaceae bacterium]|nr:acyl carrier protein [Rickettsiaceae bacterium]